MESLHEQLQEYRTQLEKGTIQAAYKGLMEYIMALRTHLQRTHPEYGISGSLYYGYMDMTYFSCVPLFFKQRKLKIAIVFLHEAWRFEVWLAGANKQVQKTYWTCFHEHEWTTYPLVPTTKGADAILEHIVVDNPDFRHAEALTTTIARGVLTFIQDVESFLSQHEHGG